MTLDLGFAHLCFDDGIEAGIIDVPGHERFLHNMLAGAAGMELLLLVVAANEGPKPQTLEHLAILRYLNVQRTILVVTKADLLEAAELPQVVTSIRAGLRDTLAHDAPSIAVSAVTGLGLAELREQIRRELSLLPARNAEAPAYLPIDRVFALPGLGTIVTGTLMQGTLGVGDRVTLTPSGKQVRVRSLQVFGSPKQSVSGGARVAANVPSIAVGEIARGEVLASPQFESQDTFKVAFAPFASSLPALRRRNPVRAYIGSAEILGTLLFDAIPAREGIHAGTLHLRRPTIAYPGASFVVRRMSPKLLLGGGTIETNLTGTDGPRTELPAQGEDILRVLAAQGLEPLEVAKLAARANLREQAAQETLDRLIEDGYVLRVARPLAYVERAAAEELFGRVTRQLGTQSRDEAWSMGMTSLALARALSLPEALLARFLAHFAEDGRIAHRSGYYAPVDHVPTLTAEQRAFFEGQIPLDPQHPFTPASLPGVLNDLRAARIAGLSKAFDTLVAKGALVKVGDDLYRGTQVAQVHARVEQFLRAEQQMTMAQFRDLLGTSRKYAVPLLEWFDARGITVRSGDVRMLRKREG